MVSKDDFDFKELVKAYLDCRRYKRNAITSLEFECNLEKNLFRLFEDLKNSNYKIGRSVCFIVLYPKPREVWAANFRDRIVHHLVYNRIKDRFYARFIKDTYSCIPSRGTLNAVYSLRRYTRQITENYTKDAYYMKADLRNFFVSIDKEILYAEIEKLVKEEWILKLIRLIIFNDPRENAFIKSPRWKFELLPKHKSLWYTDLEKGLPIGNLTSQFFSNVYLNVLDQYVKHKLKCKYYCRYVDDFILMSHDPKELNRWHKELKVFLKERLKLDLHQDKKSINKISKGIDFVGYVVKPNRLFLRQKIIKRAFQTVTEFKKSPTWYTGCEISQFLRSMNSYLGMLRGTEGYILRKELCWKSINLFISCDEDFTKLRKNIIHVGSI